MSEAKMSRNDLETQVVQFIATFMDSSDEAAQKELLANYRVFLQAYIQGLSVEQAARLILGEISSTGNPDDLICRDFTHKSIKWSFNGDALAIWDDELEGYEFLRFHGLASPTQDDIRAYIDGMER